MKLMQIQGKFSVCKLDSAAEIDFTLPYSFLAVTDDEISYACPTNRVPQDAVAVEDGWSGLKICGTLDFVLIGVISKISGLLVEEKISIFVVSTYNTDYIFVKAASMDRTAAVLTANGYAFV